MFSLAASPSFRVIIAHIVVPAASSIVVSAEVVLSTVVAVAVVAAIATVAAEVPHEHTERHELAVRKAHDETVGAVHARDLEPWRQPEPPSAVVPLLLILHLLLFVVIIIAAVAKQLVTLPKNARAGGVCVWGGAVRPLSARALRTGVNSH